GPCGTIPDQVSLCASHCNSYRTFTPCCGTAQYPALHCGGPSTA
ncbi:hypothetical protein BUE80_DR009937, partial [Diplocarpon rosae]